MSDGGEVGLPFIDDQIPFAPHTAADDSARNIVEGTYLVAESMPFGFMTGFVAAQRLQIAVAQIIARGNGLFLHNIGDPLRGVGGRGEDKFLRCDIVAECHDIDTFPVLRNTEIFTVQHLLKGSIADLSECVFDNIERTALVVNGKPLDVLAKYHFRSLFLANARDVKEEGAARHSLVIVRKPLALPGKTERLAGETRKTDIEVGDIVFVYLRNIPGDLKVVVEVRFIRLLRELVPFADEYRLYLFSERQIGRASCRERV